MLLNYYETCTHTGFSKVALILEPVASFSEGSQDGLTLLRCRHGNHRFRVHGILGFKDVRLETVLGVLVGHLLVVSLLQGCQPDAENDNYLTQFNTLSTSACTSLYATPSVQLFYPPLVHYNIALYTCAIQHYYNITGLSTTFLTSLVSQTFTIHTNKSMSIFLCACSCFYL